MQNNVIKNYNYYNTTKAYFMCYIKIQKQTTHNKCNNC